jgi:Nucleotidyltransferase of unknown function (DUF6036)
VKKTSRSTGASRQRSRGPRRFDAADALAALARVFGRRKLRWYLFGAQAVAAYGVVRATADIDVTVELDRTGLRDFVREMRGEGFGLRVADSLAFVEQTRVLPFTFLDPVVPVDVILAAPGLEDAFLGAARKLLVDGTRVPVIAPEDLIATKVLAGRPKDLEDIRGLLAQDAVPIDRLRVQRVLAALEAALDQSDLLPIFAGLEREARRARRKR